MADHSGPDDRPPDSNQDRYGLLRAFAAERDELYSQLGAARGEADRLRATLRRWQAQHGHGYRRGPANQGRWAACPGEPAALWPSTPELQPRIGWGGQDQRSCWRGSTTSRSTSWIPATAGMATSAPITPNSATPSSAATIAATSLTCTDRRITRG